LGKDYSLVLDFSIRFLLKLDPMENNEWRERERELVDQIRVRPILELASNPLLGIRPGIKVDDCGYQNKMPGFDV